MSDEKFVVPEVDSNASVEDQIKQAELAAKLMEVEIKRQALAAQALELEAKKLETEERQYHIKDLKARLADREHTDKQFREEREQQGRTFAQQAANDLYKWSICTHKKGGNVSARDMSVLSTGGNAVQYAIMKHQMINGDIWVRCLRCGKTWNPPVQKNFFFDDNGKKVAPADGKFSKERYEKAILEYKQATMFPTNNSMSTSVQCRFTRPIVDSEGVVRQIDAADTYRENIASTTLR